MRVARRVVTIVGTALVLSGFVLAWLPVSVSVSGSSVGCNPTAIDAFRSDGTNGSLPSSYRPAVVVWLNPATVNPPETESTTYSTAANQSICHHAAQNQMFAAAVLLGAALLLLRFGRRMAGPIPPGLASGATAMTRPETYWRITRTP